MGNIFASDETPIDPYGYEPPVDSIPDRTVVRKKGKQKRDIVRKKGKPIIAQPPISGNTHEQNIRF